jgi:ABC-type transporter Mla MlaB component
VSATLDIERVGADGARIVRIEGPIGFANAGEAVARTAELFDGDARLCVDLGGLSGSDSATLGVLLLWAAAAAKRHVRLTFTHPPAGLLALARLCDAEPLLGLA